MRELPEPDIQPHEAFDMGLEELPYFAEKSVLAIQRQAYEDGLRDASPGDSYEAIWNAFQRIDSVACSLPNFKVVHEGGIEAATQNIIDAMLTASQKEEK